MTWADIYSELKGWQALIGSLLGFLALLGGALFNAHLNRKRDDRLRLAEAKIVALSLYGEVTLFRKDMASLANAVGGWYTKRVRRSAIRSQWPYPQLGLPAFGA
ncbi:MAG: hypothetical protein J7500_07610 [Sphingomonas sp.]|uniref:hypothetical protein n=1 Tax=Sphingomonas sp. TaxID=28214 RepID=UPI001B285B40|nr:hypothetical protein [Sphingomonas sp.]MBO9622564.1 hypothetical protein [Sphingomonas sp.]